MNTDIISLTVDIKFCHISYHDKDWTERKTKCDYTIWNVISGGLALEINDKTLYAQTGDVLLFHPGDSYKAWCHEADHCYFLVTFFSLSSGNAIDILTASPTAGLGLYASFLTFFADLSTQFGTQILFCNSENILTDHRLQSLLSYIAENVENGLTVKSMAQFMDMSDKYFSRYFHIHIGMSPKQYLTKCRMKHAVQLLSDSDYSLSEISNILDFADQYSFTKAFKNYFGEAPGKFRKHYIESR